MARRMGALRGLHKVHLLHFIAMRSIALHVVQMLGVPVNCKQMGQFILARCR